MTLYWVIYTPNTAKHETKDISYFTDAAPDSKVHGANMGPGLIWGWQDPG